MGGRDLLVYLGIKLLRSAPSGELEAVVAEAGSVTGSGVFWHAAAVTGLNPKSIAFVSQFVSVERPLLSKFAIFVAPAAVNAFPYAVLANRLRQIIRKSGVINLLTHFGGIVLIGMGVMTAILRRQA